MAREKNWTNEDYEYLENAWGNKSIKSIAKNLDRSENAVMLKAQRLGMGAFLENGDYISFNQLLIALGSGSDGYKMQSWVRNRSFPLKTKRVRNNTFKIVKIDEFLKWAEENKSFLDFSKFCEGAIGKEPAWAKKKRRHDMDMSHKFIKTPWTVTEDEKLKYYLKAHKYGYTDLSKLMRRTEGAIQRRINDLGLKERPLRESPGSVWTMEQIELLKNLICNQYSYEAMSEQIGKSTKAIRGKVYALYGTENLDKARVAAKLAV